jgi:hypothetical protein
MRRFAQLLTMMVIALVAGCSPQAGEPKVLSRSGYTVRVPMGWEEYRRPAAGNWLGRLLDEDPDKKVAIKAREKQRHWKMVPVLGDSYSSSIRTALLSRILSPLPSVHWSAGWT